MPLVSGIIPFAKGTQDMVCSADRPAQGGCAMRPPLSPAGREILRALAVGLQLRRFDEGWRFVGHWQEPATSAVGHETIRALLDAGYILEHEQRGSITDAGRAVLGVADREMWERALEWLRSPESRLKTS